MDALSLQIAHDLVEHGGVALRLDPQIDERQRVGRRRVAGQPELLRGPQAEQLVAPRRDLEADFLAVRELVLEALLAVIEGRHESLSSSSIAASPRQRCPML